MTSARLQITVESAHNLYNADGILAGKSDPYVIVEVPGQESMKFQTQVINNDLNPVWNETGEIAGFMDGDILQFTVMDKDTWPKPDQLLGKASLVAQDFYPNGFHAEIQLDESKTAATLAVMVNVMGCDEPDMEGNNAVVVTGEEGMQQMAEPGVVGAEMGQMEMQAPCGVSAGSMVASNTQPYPGTVAMAPANTYSAPSVPSQPCYSGNPVTYSSFPTTQTMAPTTQTMTYGAPQTTTYSAPQAASMSLASQPSMTYPASGSYSQAPQTSSMSMMQPQPAMTYSAPGMSGGQTQTGGKVLQVIVHPPVTVSAQEFAQSNGTLVSTPLPVTEQGIVEKIEATVERSLKLKKKKNSKSCC